MVAVDYVRLGFVIMCYLITETLNLNMHYQWIMLI
jgi:hypothetical protein